MKKFVSSCEGKIAQAKMCAGSWNNANAHECKGWKILAKTWKGLSYDRMISKERIERATHNAGKGKRQSVSYLKYANNPKKQEGLKRELEKVTDFK